MNELAGKRILVTRPRAQAEGLVEKLSALGAVPVVFPTIEIQLPDDTRALDQAIAGLQRYHWVIFTSVNGVSAFWQRLAAMGKSSDLFRGVHVAAIGPATAEALVARGVQPDFVPQEYVAEAILPGLGEVAGQSILLPRADIARKVLVNELAQQGAFPEEIPVYTTLPAHPDPEALHDLERGIDIATFTSSSTVRNFFTLLGEKAGTLLSGVVIACIGPITAQTAREYGLCVDIIAGEYTSDGLVAALIEYYQKYVVRSEL